MHSIYKCENMEVHVNKDFVINYRMLQMKSKVM